MRCNRKTACFAVTPHEKLALYEVCYQDFAATPQLENLKRKYNKFQIVDSQSIACCTLKSEI